jgi:hypothetical protein
MAEDCVQLFTFELFVLNLWSVHGMLVLCVADRSIILELNSINMFS